MRPPSVRETSQPSSHTKTHPRSQPPSHRIHKPRESFDDEHDEHDDDAQIYDAKCSHYVDWLTEARPSFSAPRRLQLRSSTGDDSGADDVYSRRLDQLNGKFERLVESLNQRIRTAVEVNGADGLVSLKLMRTDYDDVNKTKVSTIGADFMHINRVVNYANVRLVLQRCTDYVSLASNTESVARMRQDWRTNVICCVTTRQFKDLFVDV